MKDIAITSRLERKPVTTPIERKKEREEKKTERYVTRSQRFFRIYRWPVTWREIAVVSQNAVIRKLYDTSFSWPSFRVYVSRLIATIPSRIDGNADQRKVEYSVLAGLGRWLNTWRAREIRIFRHFPRYIFLSFFLSSKKRKNKKSTSVHARWKMHDDHFFGGKKD